MSIKLSEKEWESAAPKLGKLTVDSMAMARRLFVDGITPSQLATDCGVSRQAISQLKTRVERMLSEAPAGWERVDVWLPPADAETVRQMAQTRRDAVTEA